MAQTNDHKSHDVFGTISTLSLLIAIGVTSIVSMLRIVDHMRPGVGDIIEFDATKIVAQDSEPRLEVKPADPSGVALCTLDVHHMRQSNGSLMIEARQPDPPSIIVCIGREDPPARPDPVAACRQICC